MSILYLLEKPYEYGGGSDCIDMYFYYYLGQFVQRYKGYRSFVAAEERNRADDGEKG